MFYKKLYITMCRLPSLISGWIILNTVWRFKSFWYQFWHNYFWVQTPLFSGWNISLSHTSNIRSQHHDLESTPQCNTKCVMAWSHSIHKLHHVILPIRRWTCLYQFPVNTSRDLKLTLLVVPEFSPYKTMVTICLIINEPLSILNTNKYLTPSQSFRW